MNDRKSKSNYFKDLTPVVRGATPKSTFGGFIDDIDEDDFSLNNSSNSLKPTKPATNTFFAPFRKSPENTSKPSNGHFQRHQVTSLDTMIHNNSFGGRKSNTYDSDLEDLGGFSSASGRGYSPQPQSQQQQQNRNVQPLSQLTSLNNQKPQALSATSFSSNPTSSIQNWLKSLGFELYIENFTSNDIGMEELVEITDQELKLDLGTNQPFQPLEPLSLSSSLSIP